ncbi:hypothetical protein CRUP_026651, partial [Coryphaenoides rupestris]
VVEYNPSQCLDWLAVQTPRNKLAHSWVLQNMENWVERFLLAHNYPRLPLSPDTTAVLHQVYSLLLGLLARAKLYVDAGVHGTTKL